MKKEKLQDVINRINLEDFKLYYFSHNQEQTKEYFNIGWTNLKNYIKYFNIVKSDEDIHKTSSKTFKEKSNDKLFKLSEQITLDAIIDYYDIQNHTYQECLEYFKISSNQFFKLLRYYNYHKSKEAHVELSKLAKLEKYGDSNFNNREKAKQTCLDKYGVDNCSKIAGAMNKAVNTKKSLYGSVNNWQKGRLTRIQNFGNLQSSYTHCMLKKKQTCLQKYGVSNPMMTQAIKLKAHTNFQNSFNLKYGVNNYWQLDNAKRSNGSKNSKYNLYFADELKQNNLDYIQEFNLNGKWFDFKINDNLIEINPFPTHNSTWSPYKVPLDKNYHFNKTKLARDNNYRCINIWDWDDEDKIIKSLYPKTPIYARKCIIKIINDKSIINDFENLYHFQNKCNNQQICLGLYYNDELIQIMTFGKPRYNKNYQYELLRLCTKFGYYVIGGSNKLFNYFINNYNPKSIISYCDLSKFTGTVYNKLGMKLNNISISLHWYNPKTKTHILDSLLRAKGFDKLLGNVYGCYGKGTSNRDLMLSNGFVEIYDAGQASYIWSK